MVQQFWQPTLLSSRRDELSGATTGSENASNSADSVENAATPTRKQTRSAACNMTSRRRSRAKGDPAGISYLTLYIVLAIHTNPARSFPCTILLNARGLFRLRRRRGPRDAFAPCRRQPRCRFYSACTSAATGGGGGAETAAGGGRRCFCSEASHDVDLRQRTVGG